MHSGAPLSPTTHDKKENLLFFLAPAGLHLDVLHHHVPQRTEPILGLHLQA